MATKKLAPATPDMGRGVSFDESKWRAREDMRTLSQAREIEADRRRLFAAQREAAAEVKKLQSVTRKTARK